MKYAVIDLSSTGVSVVVAEGDKATGIFEAVYKERTNIAVADYFDGRSISRRGIEKLTDALIAARSACKAMGVDECYCISTAALRNIDNIDEVAVRIRVRTGIVINYLDGETEAYCDFLSNRKYAAYDRAALVDIGGGSVELCDFSKSSKQEMICLDFGPIKLRNKYCVDIYPTEEQIKHIKKYVRKKSDDRGLPKKNEFSTVVLVGSINDAIYAAYSEYCEREKLSVEFEYNRFKQFCKWLSTSSDRTRLILKVAPEKIHILPVAAIVLKELLRRLKPDSVVISDCGVKEGYLVLVATGEEKGVPVDLTANLRTLPEAPEKADKKSTGDKKDKKPAPQKAGKKPKPAAEKAEKKPKPAAVGANKKSDKQPPLGGRRRQ